MAWPPLLTMQSVSNKQFSKYRNRLAKAFSLVEVVVAVGIFAIAIVAVIGLLSPITRAVAEVGENEDAGRVVTNIQSQLQRFPFAEVVTLLNTPPATDTARIFASRDGAKLGRGGATALWSDNGVLTNASEIDAQKFFEIQLTRNEDLSPAANDGTAGFLAFTITLRWPAYTGNGVRFNDVSGQSTLLIPAAITR